MTLTTAPPTAFDFARNLIGRPIDERTDMIQQWVAENFEKSLDEHPEMLGNSYYRTIRRDSDMRLLVSALITMIEIPSLVRPVDPDEAHPAREVWLGVPDAAA